MRRMAYHLLAVLILAMTASTIKAQILLVTSGTPVEEYAAAELQRYYYQLSGRLLSVGHGEVPDRKTEFVLTRLDHPLMTSWKDNGVLSLASVPGAQGYVIWTVKEKGRQLVVIAGADASGLLYGVYGLLEDHLGMRFYMNGDVYPDKKKPQTKLPFIRDERTLTMTVRGFLPWTNFPQSATIYSWDDWRYIIDQAARMRMNFIMIHNYNGFCGHNELFHNFEYKGHLSRGWMPTIKTGHGWCCPGWDVNEYLFGASGIYDDYDFGADYGLHNETLTNSQIKEKGATIFRKVIAYAHLRGVKIGLGLDIDVLLPEYQTEPDNREVIKAQVTEIACEYPELDYLLCFQSEGQKNEAFYARWRRVFDGFYEEMKRMSPSTRIAVSGWGLPPESVNSLPEDVICAPISYYSAAFEPGSVYGSREYWGCPWLERDFNSSEYYYPYNVDLSETIRAFGDASPNMNGFYALTWRLADAISPKMWYISKAPWYKREVLDSSEKVYRDFACASYGKNAADVITGIINQNEPFATDFGECQETPGFNQVVHTYPLMNLRSMAFIGKNGETVKIEATGYKEKKGTQNAPCDEGGECVGYIMADDWLEYPAVDFSNSPERMSVRVASASSGGVATVCLDRLEGPVIARFEVKNTEGWQSWRTLTVPMSGLKGIHTLYIRFQPFDVIAGAEKLAEAQLKTIDSCMAVTPDALQRLRLSRLRARIQGAACHIALNAGFEAYRWDDLPGKMDEWARSFLYRIEDISSYGNIMSTQNRFVKQNYVAKINQLRKQQRVQAPSHITAKGTRVGALVSWRNEEPAAKAFVVCRNGEEIDTLAAGVTCYRDMFHGVAVYSVYTVDVEGHKSPLGIPARCPAGNADREAPVIVINSPVTSVMKGAPLHIRFSVVEDRLPEVVSGTLHYRKPGDKVWKELPFERRVRAVFTLTLPASGITEEGIEYYISVSDSHNTSFYPASAPFRNHTVVVTGVQGNDKPIPPVVKQIDNNRMYWTCTENAEMYRIYRAKTPDFAVGAGTFVTFVAGNTCTFADNGFDFDGTPLKGTYYYRLTSVSRWDCESEASDIIQIDYQ